MSNVLGYKVCYTERAGGWYGMRSDGKYTLTEENKVLDPCGKEIPVAGGITPKGKLTVSLHGEYGEKTSYDGRVSDPINQPALVSQTFKDGRKCLWQYAIQNGQVIITRASPHFRHT